MEEIHRLIIACLAIALAACGSKSDQLEMQFRQECFGDHSLKCRTMMIDLAVAKMKAQVEAFKDGKENIITCIGEEKFNAGLMLGKEKISYLEDLRPSIFARTFMSSAEVEFSPPPFKHEREASELQTLLRTCNKAE